MSVTLETERQAGDTFSRPIAHHGKAGDRRAICGAEILGIPAFGEFDICENCRRLERLEYWQQHLEP